MTSVEVESAETATAAELLPDPGYGQAVGYQRGARRFPKAQTSEHDQERGIVEWMHNGQTFVLKSGQ
jgi:hypothetical protein